MVSTKNPIFTTLTPKIQLAYTSLRFVSDTEYCSTFEGVLTSNNQKYTIRSLNVTSEFYKGNSNLAATLFMQELIYLCETNPGTVIIESFESYEDRFACAIKYSQSLQQMMENQSNALIKHIDFEALLKNVLSDVKFLRSKMALSKNINISLESIYQISDTGGYFLSDWAKSLKESSISDEKAAADGRIEGPNEAYKLGLIVLEMNGISKEDIEDVDALRGAKLYNVGIETLLAELKEQPESLKESLRQVLARDPESKPKPSNPRKGNSGQAEERKGNLQSENKPKNDKVIFEDEKIEENNELKKEKNEQQKPFQRQ